ncbi:MAG: hypothetical protein ISR55_08765 [Bacteroidetes bacterium]|nr:hypothetical protein [Bacteroidota bacterium]MBL6963902.1 hypothetical protein [Bacteroidota bacterium]
MVEKKNDFIEVLRFAWKWKLYLGGISLFAAILAAIFSGPKFITPKFESYVIFYPTTQMSVSKGLLSENSYGDDDFLTVGEGEEAEQLLQILQSDMIGNKIKKRYNLMEHYGIKPDEKYANTKFGIKFHKNVKSQLTEYTSIKVSVRDEDPVMAANIANDIVEIMDTIRNNILKARAIHGMKIVEKDYKEKKAYVQSIVDSLNALAKLGVLDFEGQSDALSQAYAESVSRGNSAVLRTIDDKLAVLSEFGPTQAWLSGELEYELEEVVKLRTKYKQIKADVESIVPNKFIIERAGVPERKAFPRRSIITIVAFFSALLFSIILFVFIENFKQIKKK